MPLPTVLRMTPNHDRQLARIRALLAKAEHPSTPPPEAEAMSEKAAELMARYAIDRALLDESEARAGAPQLRSITVTSPYATPKSVLLSSVAAAYRVRTVVAPGTAGRECTLVGFTADLDIVEMLFTSLLVQASRALSVASAGQVRVRAFRHAFLMGYAVTVGRRVIDAQQRVASEVGERGSSTELVLARRSAEVDHALAAAFPRLRPLRMTVSDGLGLAAGRAAGERADIGTGRTRAVESANTGAQRT